MSLKAELETWAAALKAYDDQDFDQALQCFERIADTSKICWNIGIILATLGRHEEAVERFIEATTLDGYFTAAYYQAGVSNFVRSSSRTLSKPCILTGRCWEGMKRLIRISKMPCCTCVATRLCERPEWVMRRTGVTDVVAVITSNSDSLSAFTPLRSCSTAVCPKFTWARSSRACRTFARLQRKNKHPSMQSLTMPSGNKARTTMSSACRWECCSSPPRAS